MSSGESCTTMVTIPLVQKDGLEPDATPGPSVRKRGRKKKTDREDCPQSCPQPTPAKIRRSSRIVDRKVSKQEEMMDSSDLDINKTGCAIERGMMIDPELPLALEKCLERYFTRYKDIKIAEFLVSEEPDLTSFDECRAKNRELEEILKNLTKDFNGSRIEKDGSLLEFDQIEKCNRALKQSIADRDAEFEVQIKENKLLADEVREKDLMVESLNKAVAELEIDAKQQKKQLEALHLTFEAKQKIVEEVNEKLVARESRILSLEAEKASLEREIAERGFAQTEVMNSMKISKDDLEEKLNDRQTAIENLNQKLSKKDSEAEELTSKLQSLKVLLEEQSKKLVSKENQIEELNRKLFEMDEEAEINRSKLESVEKLRNESKEKLDEKEKVIENLNFKLKKKDGQLEELDKTHQNTITDHLSQIQALNIKIEAKREDIEIGVKMLEKKSDEAAMSKHRYEQATTEIANLNARLYQVSTENDNMKVGLNHATNMLTAVTSEKLRREERLKSYGQEAINSLRNAVNNCLEEEDDRNYTTAGKIAAMKKAIRKSLSIDFNFDQVN